jgi:hypothetical protein
MKTEYDSLVRAKYSFSADNKAKPFSLPYFLIAELQKVIVIFETTCV